MSKEDIDFLIEKEKMLLNRFNVSSIKEVPDNDPDLLKMQQHFSKQNKELRRPRNV